jgi:hypothetical protein
MRRRLVRRQWLFPARTVVYWVTFRGCANFARQVTWRYCA